ncbi:MAG TPA: FtsQ-type POTRA domain-containing protein [Polyangiaceae bacterium]|nr:FtsQ-type POTRA domain-containing protein [Polyangiaceae bacterium]
MSQPYARLHGAAISAPDESSGLVSGPGGRGRRFLAFVRFVLGLALVLGVAVAVALSVRHYVTTSPRFALEDLEVIGGRRLDVERVRHVAGIEPGANLFALEPAEIERKLLDDPWVAAARVIRKLPRGLHVELEEREPVALASIAGKLYVVDRKGAPFKELDREDPVDLPVVTGISPEGIARDRRRELERLERGLEVLAKYARLPMARSYPAQEVHVDRGGRVRLTVGEEAITLSLGGSDFDKRLAMAERVVREARALGRVPGIVFADNQAHPERVVVRMK